MKLKSFLSIILSVTLLFNYLNTVTIDAKTVENITISEREYIAVTRTERNIKTEYFKDNKLIDYSIADKTENKIYFFANKTNNQRINKLSEFFSFFSSWKQPSPDKTYSLTDFTKENKFHNSFSPYNLNLGRVIRQKPTYSFITNKKFNFDGSTEFVRVLFGGVGQYDSKEMSWHFEAGVAVSVVTAALGLYYSSLGPIMAAIGIVAGIISGLTTIVCWHKNYFWKYKVVQQSPTYEKGFTTEFVYRKIQTTQVNGDNIESKTIYEDNYPYSNALRQLILEEMGKYANEEDL